MDLLIGAFFFFLLDPTPNAMSASRSVVALATSHYVVRNLMTRCCALKLHVRIALRLARSAHSVGVRRQRVWRGVDPRRDDRPERPKNIEALGCRSHCRERGKPADDVGGVRR